VYSRKINDQILTFSASGWTYNFTFVLFDYETESMWYPIKSGFGPTCVGGEFKDLTLPAFESEITYWSTWKKKRPNTKYLKS
jgi:hypothetical protein